MGPTSRPQACWDRCRCHGSPEGGATCSLTELHSGLNRTQGHPGDPAIPVPGRVGFGPSLLLSCPSQLLWQRQNGGPEPGLLAQGAPADKRQPCPEVWTGQRPSILYLLPPVSSHPWREPQGHSHCHIHRRLSSCTGVPGQLRSGALVGHSGCLCPCMWCSVHPLWPPPSSSEGSLPHLLVPTSDIFWLSPIDDGQRGWGDLEGCNTRGCPAGTRQGNACG